MKQRSIKEWAEDDQPREKLWTKGKEALSDAELLAILIGSGSQNESAVSLARRILQETNSLDELGKRGTSFFTSFKGIGKVKAIVLEAALELGRRRQQQSTNDQRPHITSSKEAYRLLGPMLSDLNHEECWMVCLNRANRFIRKVRISTGGFFSTVVDPKVIFVEALQNHSSSIILYHNHPSGNLKPSINDIQLTKKLLLAGNSLEIKIQDHLIVAGERYFSFRDQGYL